MAVKSVDPSLKVGGPATAGLADLPAFVAACAAMGLPKPDFVSSHHYPTDGKSGPTPMQQSCPTKQGWDPNCWHTQVSCTNLIYQSLACISVFFSAVSQTGQSGGRGRGPSALPPDGVRTIGCFLRVVYACRRVIDLSLSLSLIAGTTSAAASATTRTVKMLILY